MISKTIFETFKTSIIPVIDTVATEADFKPTTVSVYRNNELVSEFQAGPEISDWANGYFLTFSTDQTVGDVFRLEVPVTVDGVQRIFRESWFIMSSSSTGDDQDYSEQLTNIETVTVSVQAVVEELTETNDGALRFTKKALEQAPSATLSPEDPTDFNLAVTVVDSKNRPIEAVTVWFTLDFQGFQSVSPVKLTNAVGVALFYLEPGTYYLWRQKTGIVFSNPSPITIGV
jgi:hypothetical protein